MKKPISKAEAARALSKFAHESMTPEQRRERSKKANEARWGKKKKKGAAK